MTLTQTRSFEARFRADMRETEARRLSGATYPCGRCDAELTWNKDAIRAHNDTFHAAELSEGLVTITIGGGGL